MRASAKRDTLFERWMDSVEREIRAGYCFGAVELEDAPYRQWFDESLSPHEAERRAVRWAYDATHPPMVLDG